MSTKTVTRDQIAENYKWDLTPLFGTTVEWEKSFGTVERIAAELSTKRDQSPTTALELRHLLDLYFSGRRELEKVSIYAGHQHDTNLADQRALELYGKAANLEVKFFEAASFIEPMFLALPEPQRAAFLGSSELATYHRYLSEIERFAPHTLSSPEESILARGQELFSATEKVFAQLNNTDLHFGAVVASGVQHLVTHGSFTSLLRNPDRDLRSQVWHSYYGAYDAHKNTFAAILSGIVKRDIFLSRGRRYPSSRAAALFQDAVPESVYDSLVSATRAGIEPLHQYWSLRGQKLQLKQQHLYDTYIPIVAKPSREFSFEEACELIVEACAPLGSEYTSILCDGLKRQRWVDVYESKGKRSGAYSGGCYDSYPYILMNYRDDSIDSVFTLAHEAGHSMHSYLTRRSQSYQDSNYSIVVAEVASTVNEQLLLRHLRQKFERDQVIQRYLLNYEIDSIKATIFRQVMFAEFEQRIHVHAERGEALTVEFYLEQYRDLLSAYFGPSVHLLPLDSLECFRIPHFYWNFYVYKYATGLASAIVLADRIADQRSGVCEKYLEFLRAGASVPPIDLLRKTGIDLTSPEPVEMALGHFKAQVERFVVALAAT